MSVRGLKYDGALEEEIQAAASNKAKTELERVLMMRKAVMSTTRMEQVQILEDVEELVYKFGEKV